MALGKTNISTTLVGNELGNSSRNVGVLCSASNINKWSKFKPVISTESQEGATNPSATNGQHGFDLANNWAYDKPTGGASEPFRLGDFRGYQHVSSVANKCMPPIFCYASEFESDDLYPAPSTGSSIKISNSFRIRVYRDGSVGGNNEFGIIPSSITPNLDNYYYGIKLTKGATSWFKADKLVSAGSPNGIVIDVNVRLEEANGGINSNDWSFLDFPQGVGDYTAELIITSTLVANWTTTVPSYFRLPSGTFDGLSYAYTHTLPFTVHHWLVANLSTSETDMIWTGLEEDEREAVISVEAGDLWRIKQSTLPSWISYKVGFWYYDDLGATKWKDVLPDANGYYDKADVVPPIDAATTPLITGWLVLKVDPDQNGTTDRLDDIDFEINGVVVNSLTLDQKALVTPPAFTVFEGISPETIVDNGSSGVDGGYTINMNVMVSGWVSGSVTIHIANTQLGVSKDILFNSNGALTTNLTTTSPLANNTNYTLTITEVSRI